MLGIQLMVLAGFLVALSNYCFRRSIDAGGSGRAFLVVQPLVVCLVAILLNPVRTGVYEWSSNMGALGVLNGVIVGTMMLSLNRALECGPPALTFALLNSSSLFPIIVMVLFFGSTFGYEYTLWNGIGSIFVIFGLFWASYQKSAEQVRTGRWAIFALGAFALHTLFLVVMQWRVLLMNFSHVGNSWLSLDSFDAQTQWFMPMTFLTAAAMQSILYVRYEKRLPSRREVLHGVLGGLFNGVGTFCMICSTERATSVEQAMIFPIFSITIVIACNIWGQWRYQEKVNWKANAACLAGIAVGTLDWASLLYQT